MRTIILRSAWAASVVFAMAVMGGQVVAQEPAQAAVRGTFNDYVWVATTGSGAGAWHVTGQWTAQVNRATGRGEFIASLLGVRSDLWVLQTGADPTNPALRTPHTHHIGLLNSEVTVIPNGVRLTGTAIITSNGSVAPFSGSLVQVDITGGSMVAFSNIKLTFLGAAVDHFGPQAYDGIVVFER